jgi:hypothetical protein
MIIQFWSHLSPQNSSFTDSIPFKGLLLYTLD